MKTRDPNELLFSRSPRISVADVRGWLERLKQGDETAKRDLIKFIRHRLRGRYITPLLHVPNKFKSGFLMMASACLLIESLQTFYDGKNESGNPNKDPNEVEVGSEAAFVRFFEKHSQCFPLLRDCFPLTPKTDKNGNLVIERGAVVMKCAFYKHIRCGILHQAETTNCYSIVRDGTPLFDLEKETVNADTFLKTVKACLNKYLINLRNASITSDLWDATATKLGHICNNFEHGVA